MPTIQIRHLPRDIYDDLKKMSAESRRSMTQQAIYFIEKGIEREKAFKESEIRRKAALSRLKEMKSKKVYDTQNVEEWIVNDRTR